ncbi:MAG: helix-turn-helix domain-containing protein [Xanthomonadales bacterium]|nr:helix-turn-helix domain-containing protein [Xanthomonadales bacterium]
MLSPAPPIPVEEAKIMDHVSKKEAAKILGLGLSTLDRWHANGYGPHRYLYGGRVKYERAELLRFLEQVSRKTQDRLAA